MVCFLDVSFAAAVVKMVIMLAAALYVLPPSVCGYSSTHFVCPDAMTCMQQCITACRDYALLFGSVGLTTTFIPSFRNMRIFSFIAILGTTFTAWYMVAQASSQGLQKGLWGQGPTQGVQSFVEGSTNLLFVYGGHAMLM